jgi:hypothetical protein
MVTFALLNAPLDAAWGVTHQTLVAAKANLIEWGHCTSQGSLEMIPATRRQFKRFVLRMEDTRAEFQSGEV